MRRRRGSSAWLINKRTAGLLSLGCMLTVAVNAGAQAKPSLPPAAPAPVKATSPAQSTITVDHHQFDDLLHRFVVKGMVDYDAFARAPEFGAYLVSLNAVRPELLSEDERLAFWINTYNAFTIQLVVSHHETETIRNINRTFGALRLKGPWSDPFVRAAGRVLTLDEIHHTILRKEFAEPRIHFALACGAMGCPPLRSEAYTGAKLVDQLNDQGHVFLRESPTKNRIDKQGLVLSPVIMSFRTDFGAGRQDVLRALAPYFDEHERKAMEGNRFWIQTGSFDWTLNSQAKAKQIKPMPPEKVMP